MYSGHYFFRGQCAAKKANILVNLKECMVSAVNMRIYLGLEKLEKFINFQNAK